VATLRRLESDRVDVRRLLAEHFREVAAEYPFLGEPWSEIAARIDAGEAWEVSGWQVSRWVDGVGADDRLRLEPDGSLTMLCRGVVPPADRSRLRRW